MPLSSASAATLEIDNSFLACPISLTVKRATFSYSTISLLTVPTRKAKPGTQTQTRLAEDSRLIRPLQSLTYAGKNRPWSTVWPHKCVNPNWGNGDTTSTHLDVNSNFGFPSFHRKISIQIVWKSTFVCSDLVFVFQLKIFSLHCQLHWLIIQLIIPPVILITCFTVLPAVHLHLKLKYCSQVKLLFLPRSNTPRP